MILEHPIAIGLSPNTQNDDIWEAFKIILQPWNWKEGKAIKKVEQWFKDYFEVQDTIAFNSGRSALYAILKTLGIGKDDEVLLQAFTCVAVPDPVIWIGAKPIFVDVDETLNIDSMAIEKHITSKSKAIIVQHTFGIPAKIDMITKIAQKHELLLIEDCAHSLGATYKGKKIGTFGDAAFFSFGRDKIISSVFGGLALINSKFKIQNLKLRKFQETLKYPNYFWIFQQLLHPIIFSVILPLYHISVGKILLFFLQKLGLLSKPVYPEEYCGQQPRIFPTKYPNALAFLLLNQLKKLDKYNSCRKKNSAYYYEKLSGCNKLKLPVKTDGAVYLRYNVFTADSEAILNFSKRRGILLGNWYKNIIDPKEVNYKLVGYKKGQCPFAEHAAKLSVNLPTYPRLTTKELNSVLNLIYER